MISKRILIILTCIIALSGCLFGAERFSYAVHDIGTSKSFDFENMTPIGKTDRFSQDTREIVAYYSPDTDSDNIPIYCQWNFEGDVIAKQEVQLLDGVYNVCWITSENGFSPGSYRITVLFGPTEVRSAEFVVLDSSE